VHLQAIVGVKFHYVKKPRQQGEQRAVAEMRKVFHKHRAQGEVRLRVLTTLAAETISRQLGTAMRRELQPDAALLAITRRRLRQLVKAKKFGGAKSGNT